MKNTIDLMTKDRVIGRSNTLLYLTRFLSYKTIGDVIATKEYPYTLSTTITISKSKL